MDDFFFGRSRYFLFFSLSLQNAHKLDSLFLSIFRINNICRYVIYIIYIFKKTAKKNKQICRKMEIT